MASSKRFDIKIWSNNFKIQIPIQRLGFKNQKRRIFACFICVPFFKTKRFNGSKTTDRSLQINDTR